MLSLRSAVHKTAPRVYRRPRRSGGLVVDDLVG
jgi:hypothetical protein